ncbi:integrating conjugative element protein [Pseudomonas sp. MT3]
MKLPLARCLVALSLTFPYTLASAGQLVVVEDHGGVSALPYYQDLVPDPADAQRPPLQGVQIGGAFPVVTPEMTPGLVQGRVINAPGLQPLFLVGDDESSRTWLQQHLQQLQQLQAVGLVVNVSGPSRLAEVRKWGPGLQLLPTPGSDIAGRLGLRHYPVLITSTTVQQ